MTKYKYVVVFPDKKEVVFYQIPDPKTGLIADNVSDEFMRITGKDLNNGASLIEEGYKLLYYGEENATEST